MILPEIAISVRQPKAYLAGCLKGDAWFERGRENQIRGYIGLRVADPDFCHAFADALFAGYGVQTNVRFDRGYTMVKTYNGHGRFDELREFEPEGLEAQASWLRGLFDSEGNVVCSPKPRGPNSWDRRVAFFSTEQTTLERAKTYLSALNVTSRIRRWTHSAGHIGTKQVYALLLDSSKANYETFARHVGSSIARKAGGIAKIPTTYHPDLSSLRRDMQRRGVEVRLARKAARGR